MTAPAKAASNGSKDTPAKPERKTGMAFVREAVAYHTANVAYDAAFEAERLCNEIYRTASGAYLRDGGSVSEAAQALSDPDMQRKIQEARDCLYAAQDHLRFLADEPPF
jgi:hypothetical protein